MFNAAGSPTGACQAVLWVGLGQEGLAVEGEHSHYAPCASLLAQAPAMQHIPRALYVPTSGMQQNWEVDSKATETISDVASFCSGDTQEHCLDSDGEHYSPGSPSRWWAWNSIAANLMKGYAMPRGIPALLLCCTAQCNSYTYVQMQTLV